MEKFPEAQCILHKVSQSMFCNVSWKGGRQRSPCLQGHSLVEEKDNTHLILDKNMSVPPNRSLRLGTCLSQMLN